MTLLWQAIVLGFGVTIGIAVAAGFIAAIYEVITHERTHPNQLSTERRTLDREVRSTDERQGRSEVRRRSTSQQGHRHGIRVGPDSADVGDAGDGHEQ